MLTCLCFQKIVLGWILDSLTHTLELPPHQLERLQQIFDDLQICTQVGISKWQKVLGELRSMAIGIPGSQGLLTLLQEGLKYKDKNQICITTEMQDQLADFEYLKKDLGSQPTHLLELVPDHLVAVGPHDASGDGIRGVAMATSDHQLKPQANLMVRQVPRTDIKLTSVLP